MLPWDDGVDVLLLDCAGLERLYDELLFTSDMLVHPESKWKRKVLDAEWVLAIAPEKERFKLMSAKPSFESNDMGGLDIVCLDRWSSSALDLTAFRLSGLQRFLKVRKWERARASTMRRSTPRSDAPAPCSHRLKRSGPEVSKHADSNTPPPLVLQGKESMRSVEFGPGHINVMPDNPVARLYFKLR